MAAIRLINAFATISTSVIAEKTQEYSDTRPDRVDHFLAGRGFDEIFGFPEYGHFYRVANLVIQRTTIVLCSPEEFRVST